jgi:hypothetical protein
MVNTDMQPTPLAATKFAEEQLNALLDEAYAAHEAVGRLVNNRPSIAYGTPLPLPVPTPTLPTPMPGSGRQTPLPDGSFKRAGIFGVQGVSMTPQLVIPAEVASLPAQLMALQRRVDELGSSQQQQQHHQQQQQQQHQQHQHQQH